MRAAGTEVKVDVLDSASLGLSLGPPRGLPEGEPLSAEAAAARTTSIEAGGERYQLLPLRAGLPAADAAAVFSDGGAARARARIAASRKGSSRADGNAEGPAVVAVRVVSRGELLVSASTSGALDCCAAAAVALAAAASVGYADREAMARLGSSAGGGAGAGALWVEWAQSGSLYVAARPEYVYRGEFHINE